MTQDNSPQDDSILENLLEQWDAANFSGKPAPSVEELTRDHPHLTERLREAIERIKGADAALGGLGAPSNDPSNPPELIDPMPEMIGPYRIIEKIGQGGMGTVYRAEQREPIFRTVALKQIKLGFDSREVLARFDLERQALALMDHPNIARVIDAGTDERGRPHFVMEFVPGKPITRFCDENRLSIRERLTLFRQVCDAITHAHIKAIIHRDIKASNVLAFLADGKPMVKVIDFGIAKAISGERIIDRTFNTAIGLAIGTYESMSPEQADGSRDIDTRTDVYSLGILLYELLTGAQPFDVATLSDAADAEIRRIIREVEPPRPSSRFSSLGNSVSLVASARQSKAEQLAKDLRSDLEWIPLKAMRKERQHRYTSALQLSEDIDNYLNGRPLIAGPESRVYRLKKFARRRAHPLAASLIVTAAAIGGTALYIHQIRQEQAKTALALAGERNQRIRAESNLILAELRQANLAAQRGKWSDSLQAYDEAESAGAADAKSILLGKVLALQNLGRTTEAQTLVTESIRKNPGLATDPVVMVHEGELIWSTRPDEGERLIRSAIAQDMPAAEKAFGRGLLAGSIPEAIEQFKQVIADDPFRQDAYGLTASLSTIIGNWSDADEFTTAWMRMFPDDPSARIVRAFQCAFRGDAAGATQFLNQAKAQIDARSASQLQRAMNILIDFSAGKPPDLADTMTFAETVISQDQLRFGTSNLLMPRILGRCVTRLADGVESYLAGIAAEKLVGKFLANPQYLRSAKSFESVFSDLPISMVQVLRAMALEAGDATAESARAFAIAAAQPSPIDVAGYAHLRAATNYWRDDQAKQVMLGGARITDDTVAVEQIIAAAERGAIGQDQSVWATSALVIVSGRRTDQARTFIQLWKKRFPNEPLAYVWEAENEYAAGNYGTALRLLRGAEQRFSEYDFSGLADLRAKCQTAINDRSGDPPPKDQRLPDASVHRRLTTQPMPAPGAR